MPATRNLIDYALVLALRSQGLTFDEISKQINHPAGSIKAGFYRLRLDEKLAKSRESVGMKLLKARSEHHRSRLATSLEDSIELLASNPVLRVEELANSPEGEGRASVLNRLADVAAKVYGDWGDTGEKGPRISLGSLTINAGSSSEGSVNVIDVSGKQES